MDRYHPNVVLAASDIYHLPEMHLMDYAKKIHALRICLQPSLIGPKAIISLLPKRLAAINAVSPFHVQLFS